MLSLKSKKIVTSLASPPLFSPSSTNDNNNHDRMDLDSVRAVIVSINKYLHELVANPNRQNDLKQRCSSLLKTQKQEFFEFSEHSILSNLYWGMDSIDAAMEARSSEERNSRLTNAEKMLQVPALLSEDEATAGIPNNCLVCISYLYLSLVKRLQREDWQVAMHFLQAVLVSPSLVRKALAPDLCEFLFPSTSSKPQERKRMGWSPNSESSSFGDETCDAMKRLARRYRDWLMYYQVMLYGETVIHGDYGWNMETTECELWYSMDRESASTEYSYLMEARHTVPEFPKRHSGDAWNDAVDRGMPMDIMELSHHREGLRRPDKGLEIADHDEENKRKASMKRLQDMLKEPQSDTSTIALSPPWGTIEEGDLEEDKNTEGTRGAVMKNAEESQLEIIDWNLQEPCSTSNADEEELSGGLTFTQSLQHLIHSASGVHTTLDILCPGKIADSSIAGDFNLSILELRDRKHDCWTQNAEDLMMIQRTSEQPQLFDQIAATSRARQMDEKEASATKNRRKSCNFTNLSKYPGKDDLLGIFENVISKLCFSEGFTKMDEESVLEITAIYEMLSNKSGVKYTMLKDVILDQLLTAILTSEEDRVVRISVSILTTIVQGNQSVLGDIKRKGLRLCDLASALKRNVHEAATLIYLINPSPTEIKTLEILPTLVEVICSWSTSKLQQPLIPLTPPVASLMIIEVLVTAFDSTTNTMHLAEISSPRVLHGLLDVARDTKAEESISLATIIVKCMQFDGQCRIYVSQFTPVAPFIRLLHSNKKRAKFIALEFFHEILFMPRSAAIILLERIRDEGGATLMQNLMLCLQKLPTLYQLFAANLLIQLETLQQANASSKDLLSEAAMQVLLSALTSEESSMEQQLSAFILSNLGGTYSWTGEPYTVAWLVKKAGLTSPYHRNMIKDFDWDDQSLEDTETDSWCSKVARSVTPIGKPVFETLEMGLKSKMKRVSRDSLTAIAWLGCEISRSPHTLRYSACEILLGGLEKFLHPGVDLEERLLASMCIYNYASGKGMQKLINFSEGVRESLRRFSSITWMAEELHKVADYYLPNKSRISCVHTQILEAGQNGGGAVNALIYYKGLLWSGHSDGSIKVWDIKGQTATLVWDNKEHKKAVTCFSLFEQGESLLSGSADKTIKVWKMVRGKLECIEVIWTKEPIQQLDTCGKMIFVIPQGHGVKVIGSTRTVKEICKSRNVKSMNITLGKIYIGCKDSSIQELALANYREREIKPSARRWIMQKRPISSITVYKEWIYTASSVVEGSNMKDWRRSSDAQTKIVVEKGANIIAMGVVEDFIYLTSSSSPSVLQIWLRGKPHKAGRISAGSRITSLLTANDKVFCGTEAGLIKGWIPL